MMLRPGLPRILDAPTLCDIVQSHSTPRAAAAWACGQDRIPRSLTRGPGGLCKRSLRASTAPQLHQALRGLGAPSGVEPGLTQSTSIISLCLSGTQQGKCQCYPLLRFLEGPRIFQGTLPCEVLKTQIPDSLPLPLTPSAAATQVTLLFLQHTEHDPAPGPLHRLLPASTVTCPPVAGYFL